MSPNRGALTADLLADPILDEEERLPGARAPFWLPCVQDSPDLRELMRRAVDTAAESWRVVMELVRRAPDAQARVVIAQASVLRLLVRARALLSIINATAETLGTVSEADQKTLFEQAQQLQEQSSTALDAVVDQLIGADRDTLTATMRAQLLEAHVLRAEARLRRMREARNQAVADALDIDGISSVQLGRRMRVTAPAVRQMARMARAATATAKRRARKP